MFLNKDQRLLLLPHPNPKKMKIQKILLQKKNHASAAKGKTIIIKTEAAPKGSDSSVERPYVTILIDGTPIRIQLVSSPEVAVPTSSSSSASASASTSDTSDNKGSSPKSSEGSKGCPSDSQSPKDSEAEAEKACSPKLFERGYLRKFLRTNSKFTCSYKNDQYGWDFGFAKGTNLAEASTSEASSKGTQKEDARGSFNANLNVRGVTIDLMQLLLVLVLVKDTVVSLFGGKPKPSTD